MEYKFMGELTGDEAEKELASLFEKLMSEVRDNLQRNYDQLLPAFKMAPSVDRTVHQPSEKTAEPFGLVASGQSRGNTRRVYSAKPERGRDH